ncbi:hypothetical protein [Singulisphaera acidiphila]|uniref:Uncharacterized protein n=1 Tax=Singulisphaera acidiphila (strain ATCC BAA-1392 / DSM 18658 / VKM B-2454 / MOB10) TaxID=886293 RepID=L0D700_SINAD|nr:hypothetical protein [Singulisphaera acidiphila]AGA24655.1 hypothetical protein Sinac_0204 [Singulisphaera acidiphila DSM 18658]
MTRTTLTALALIGSFAGPAFGQINFIGPGSTPQGDILRGEGVFLQGAGMFNYYTAQADSINADTMMRINEYIYLSIRQDRAEKAARRARRTAERLANFNLIRSRVENNPNQNDMLKGNALNALFEQLAGPKIPPSSYRLNSFELDADMVRKIPFFYGPNQETIALSRIIPAGQWPIALRGPEFASQRRNYEHALDAVLELQLDRKTTRDSLSALSVAVHDLAERLDQVISPEKETLYLEAKRFIRRLEASKEMMKRKDVELIIGELDRYSGTTVHDLVVFMQQYNLRFGVPEIGAERATYPKLYAAMRQQLDELNETLQGEGRAPRVHEQ